MRAVRNCRFKGLDCKARRIRNADERHGSSSSNLVSLVRSDSSGSNSDSESYKSGAKIASSVNRHGLIAAFATLADFQAHVSTLLSMIPQRKMGLKNGDFVNVVHVILLCPGQNEAQTLAQLQSVVTSIKDDLHTHLIRRVSFSVKPIVNTRVDNTTSTYHLYPGIYTFRHSMNYQKEVGIN